MDHKNYNLSASDIASLKNAISKVSYLNDHPTISDTVAPNEKNYHSAKEAIYQLSFLSPDRKNFLYKEILNAYFNTVKFSLIDILKRNGK